MNWTEDDIREMYRQYLEEWLTLKEVGARHGISLERVRQLFARHNLPRRTNADIIEGRHQRNLTRAAELTPQIEAAYRQHGNLEAVYEAVDLPQKYIRMVVSTMLNREAYRRRGDVTRLPIERLRDDIRRAAQVKGEPLTASAYRAVARELGLVAYNTLIKEYDVFARACADAGVRAYQPKGPYKGTITAEACIQAVLDCVIANNGERPSFSFYSLWAKDNDRPSGPTVRLRVPGGWNGAVAEAFARYAMM